MFHHSKTNPNPRRNRAASLAIAGLLTVAFCAAARAADVAVRLRNDLTPGALATYRISIKGERTSPFRRWEEKLTFEQSGRLTLLVIDEVPKKAQARRTWMMELDEPVVVSLLRDGQAVDGTFSAKAVGLPPKVVQLQAIDIDGSRAAASPAGGSMVQRLGMLLSLDFAHWPEDLAAVGETWEADAGREELQGTWTFRYDATEGRGADRLAVGSFAFEGAATGAFAGAATIESVEGTWKWRVAKRCLHSSTARVKLRYGEREEPRTLELNVALEAERLERLPDESLKQAREELAQVGEMAGALNSAESEKALADLKAFAAGHAKSIWLPVVTNLLERTAFEADTFGDMNESQLRDALVKLITRWQMADMGGHPEALQPVRATFRELTDAHRETLHKLTRDEDANTRAIATFCVAFGEEASDLAPVVANCSDDEARVRAWAAYGLAERRDEALDSSVLRALLEDENGTVRQRACMAVGACIRRDGPDRAAFMKQLVRMALEDPDHAVRGRAAEAIDALAVKEDLPVLIEVESKLDVPPARRQIEFTVRRLGGEPKDVDD